MSAIATLQHIFKVLTSNLLRSALGVLVVAALLIFGTNLVFGQVGPGQVNLQGILGVTIGDPAPGSALPSVTTYTISDSNGLQTELILDEKLLQGLGGVRATVGKEIKITGTITVRPASAISSATEAVKVDSLQVVPGTQYTAQAITGSKAYLNILCKFKDVAQEPKTPAYFSSLMTDPNYGMNKYWTEESNGNINLNGSAAVTKWYVLPQNKSYYVTGGNFDNAKLANDCGNAPINDINVNSFAGLNFMFNDVLTFNSDGGFSRGGWGQVITIAGVPKAWSVTWMAPWGYGSYANFSGGPGGLSHEMGHSFTLPHSTDPTGTQTYGNSWDVMSDVWTYCSLETVPVFSCLGQHTNAWDKDQLGWIPPARKFTYPGLGQSTINLESSAIPANNANYLIAYIPIKGSNTHFYTVEARYKNGFDVKLPAAAIIIHDVDTTRQWGYQAKVMGTDGHAGAEWLAPSTFTDLANNVIVQVNSTITNGFNITISTAVPTAPTNLVAQPVSQTQINLSWNDNSANETGFTISRKTSSTSYAVIANLGANVTTYNDTGLTAGTTYYYLIQAENPTTGPSAVTGPAVATTWPSSPGTLNLSVISSVQINLSWSNAAGETGYYIQRNIVGTSGPWSTVATVAADTTTFSDTLVGPGTTYYYRVGAFNSGGTVYSINTPNATTPAADFTVTFPTDNSTVNSNRTTPGYLSYALLNATSGKSIIFSSVQTVTVSGVLPAVQAGAVIFGGNCGSTPITIMADPTYPALPVTNGLTLSGGNVLTNLIVKGFPGVQIVTGQGGRNTVQCSAAKKS